MIKLLVLLLVITGCQSIQRGIYQVSDEILPGSVFVTPEGKVCSKSAIRERITCE